MRSLWASWPPVVAAAPAPLGPPMLAPMPGPDHALTARARQALGPVRTAQHGVFTPEQARAAGLTDAQVRTLVRRGTWSVVRRGWLAESALARDAEAGHRLACHAKLLRVGNGPVVSHESAWLLHRLPLESPPREPLLTLPWSEGVQPPYGVRTAWLPQQQITRSGALSVTTAERTVADVLRTSDDLLLAQQHADAARRQGISFPSVQQVLAACEGWPGVRQARGAWEFSDPRAESPLESRCRVWFRAGGLPVPESQVVLRDERGVFVARVDFFFRKQRTIVEADGRVKYTDPYGGQAGLALWKEKRREDWLRDLGFEVVRATWADNADAGAALVGRVGRAFVRGKRWAA